MNRPVLPCIQSSIILQNLVVCLEAFDATFVALPEPWTSWIQTDNANSYNSICCRSVFSFGSRLRYDIKGGESCIPIPHYLHTICTLALLVSQCASCMSTETNWAGQDLGWSVGELVSPAPRRLQATAALACLAACNCRRRLLRQASCLENWESLFWKEYTAYWTWRNVIWRARKHINNSQSLWNKHLQQVHQVVWKCGVLTIYARAY
jgi:hypothetical protein